MPDTPSPAAPSPAAPSPAALAREAVPEAEATRRELPRRARIYQPARNAMQSGTARTRGWVLDFEPADPRVIDPLMGWTSSDDTQRQVRLRFDTREQAVAYAKAEGLETVVQDGHRRSVNIRPRGYGENFAPDRRIPWTH